DVPVRAIGTLEHKGRSTAVARGELRGSTDGRLYATGTTTCLVMRPDSA
ncbi:MAG: PaaI family thioesterase, partial [Roseovarius sp.]